MTTVMWTCHVFKWQPPNNGETISSLNKQNHSDIVENCLIADVVPIAYSFSQLSH